MLAACPTGLPVIKWHADGIDVPDDVAVLASTATPGCAVFRVGDCAWGSQMHLEADDAMLFDRWLPDPIEIAALEFEIGKRVGAEHAMRGEEPVQLHARAETE